MPTCNQCSVHFKMTKFYTEDSLCVDCAGVVPEQYEDVQVDFDLLRNPGRRTVAHWHEQDMNELL